MPGIKRRISARAAPTLALPGSPPGQNPDSPLIDLASEAVRLGWDYEHLIWALDQSHPLYGTPQQEAALLQLEAVEEAHAAAFERLSHMRATTLDGLRAKARAVRSYYGNYAPDEDCTAGPALWSLVLDLAGTLGAA
jgi:hypothetical protein